MTRISEQERARRRHLQMKKVAKARKVLGAGLAVGATFGIGMFIKNIIDERRLERQEQLALEWTRQQRLRRDAEFRQRDEQRRERERRAEGRLIDRLAAAPERERNYEEYVATRIHAMALAAVTEHKRQVAEQKRQVNPRYGDRQQIEDARNAADAVRNLADAARNAAEAKFVRENPPLPIQGLPECFGPDPISQEEVNLTDNRDAVAIIYERGNPLRAHCFERPNFEDWWSNANLFHSSKYAYDRNQPNSQYQIFRLYNDQTYITEYSTKILRESPAKVFQRVFFKKVLSGTDAVSIDLHVLIPVPVA